MNGTEWIKLLKDCLAFHNPGSAHDICLSGTSGIRGIVNDVVGLGILPSPALTLLTREPGFAAPRTDEPMDKGKRIVQNLVEASR